MKNKNYFIISNEYDFLKQPIALKSIKIKKKGFGKIMIADLETPINIWNNQKLSSYSKVLLKPRYLFQSFKRLKSKEKLTVNIASFDGHNIDNFRLSDLKIIGIAEMYNS